MRINHNTLANIVRQTQQTVAAPESLTERIIQFGTGVLLRGLPDYYINHANRMQTFDGSIILVKSTLQGDIHAFKCQDNLYTIQTEGIEKGRTLQNQQIITCISKVLTVQEDWQQLIHLSKQADITYIISNTTESGIVEIAEDLSAIPLSFPGRLTALLFHRFTHFDGDPSRGWIILPTELIDNNADKLKEIIISIAKKNDLPNAFIDWIISANHFCNTLVDRIVPGSINTSEWLYEDRLAIAVEPFNLWAIEVKNTELKEKIKFASGNPGIILMESIQDIKELKIRLLNASHIILCPISKIAGYTYVRESLGDPTFENWLENLMQTEVTAHLLKKNIPIQVIDAFRQTLIDRLKNPFIDHNWSSIAQNSTSKWIQRVLPILQSWSSTHTQASASIALSMAAYLKCHKLFNDTEFPLDTQIEKAFREGASCKTVLGNTSIWTIDLNIYSDFTDLVDSYYQDLDHTSINQLINKSYLFPSSI